MPTTVVDVIELARDGIEAKRKNATMLSRQTDIEAKLVEITTSRCTMSGQTSAAEKRVKWLKLLLVETQLSPEKQTNESVRMAAELCDKISVSEELLRTKETRVKRLERILTTEAEKRQQLVAKRRETRETAIRQIADGEDSIQSLQSKVVAVTAERDEWFGLADESSNKFKMAKTNAALHLSLRKTLLEDTDARTAEMIEL